MVKQRDTGSGCLNSQTGGHYGEGVQGAKKIRGPEGQGLGVVFMKKKKRERRGGIWGTSRPVGRQRGGVGATLKTGQLKGKYTEETGMAGGDYGEEVLFTSGDGGGGGGVRQERHQEAETCVDS